MQHLNQVLSQVLGSQLKGHTGWVFLRTEYGIKLCIWGQHSYSIPRSLGQWVEGEERDNLSFAKAHCSSNPTRLFLLLAAVRYPEFVLGDPHFQLLNPYLKEKPQATCHITLSVLRKKN